LELATNVIVQADIHAREVRAAVKRLLEVVEQQAPASTVPKVHETEPVRQAYLSLALLDKTLGSRGEAIYTAPIEMDTYTEPLRLDPWKNFEPFTYNEYQQRIDAYFAAMDAFRDEWRSRER
jgi:hypothetical protein